MVASDLMMMKLEAKEKKNRKDVLGLFDGSSFDFGRFLIFSHLS